MYKLVSAKTTLVFNWLELVIELNLTFTFVENPIARKAVKYEDISVDFTEIHGSCYGKGSS